MRKLIQLINENNEIEEDCVEHDQVWRSTWTEWQNRDGIYLVLPASNSVYVGFCRQEEAEDYAETLDGDWRVVRHGRYADMTDDEAEVDPEIRHNRIKYGFYVKPMSEINGDKK